MNVNCEHWGKEFLIRLDLLIGFNKKREIFPSVGQVLSIFLSTSAASEGAKRRILRGA